MCYTVLYDHLQAYYAIFKYAGLVLWAVGTVGNLLTLVVLHGRRYGFSSANVAVSALALADIGMINIFCLNVYRKSLVFHEWLYHCNR